MFVREYNSTLKEGEGVHALLPGGIIADLAEVTYPTFIVWMKRAPVVPARPAVRGDSSRPNMFHYKTAIGIARAAAFQYVYGSCPVRFVKALVAASEAEHDAFYEAFFASKSQLAEDPALEEEWLSMIRGQHSTTMTAEEEAWITEWMRRCKKILAAYKLFGYGQPDRPAAPHSMEK